MSGVEPNVRLMDILSASLIETPLKSTNKWDAIQELVNLCAASGALPQDKLEAAAEAVSHREQTMSTGLERGIAIPHGALPDIHGVIGALGISRDGIEFESVDGELTHLVLLMIIPKNMFQKHIRTLAGISHLLDHDDLRRQLISANTPQDAMAAIQKAEEGLPS